MSNIQPPREQRQAANAEANRGHHSLMEAEISGTTPTPPDILAYAIEPEMKIEELRQAHDALEASRHRYTDLFEFAPIGFLTLTPEGLISTINLAGVKLLGMERQHLIHRRFARFVADQDKDHWYRLFLNMTADADCEKHCFDLLLKHADGSIRYAYFDCRHKPGVGGAPVLRLAFANRSQPGKANPDIFSATAPFENHEGIVITDANKTIVEVNQAFTRITGYSAAESIGQTTSLFNSGYHDAAFYAAMWESINRTGAWQGKILNRRKNGEIYPEHLTITSGGSDDNDRYYVAHKTDISQPYAATLQIAQLGFYDPLTHLPNRRLLKGRLHLAQAYSSRSKRPSVLLFINLDNFKAINDSFGPNQGDMVLQQVAQRLASNVREEDTIARLGADEFAVIMGDLSEDPEAAAIHAEVAARKLLVCLNQPYHIVDQDYRCTSSIGAVIFTDHEVAEDELLQQVDIALYCAKQGGRNRLFFYNQAMRTVVTERAAMEADLHLALENNQFKLYYQIQANQNCEIVGAEVLIRWQHPRHGLISPIDFIPLAEKTGLILPIGQWVLESVGGLLKKWEDTAHTRHLELTVNVSAYQLHQPDFFEKICKVLEKTAITPSRLKLELTERMVLNDIDDTIAKMQMLKIIGVHFSLDDLGTGYSSLAYFNQLPLDQLKIDQRFVHNMANVDADAIVVQTLINMANNLGIEVIAEGVETENQRRFLEENGCLLYQGYLFGKPMPLEELEDLLANPSHTQA
ncbi:MAG: EAL domain-containing protein [Methylococcales bacterium]|nr:EAL domain-containing protein [Methylococcales bacterium]